MNGNYEFFGHTIEMRVSNSGSHDPWTGDYAREKGVGLIGTADIKTFILIDGDTVYGLKRGGQLHFINALQQEFSSWEEAQETINKFVDSNEPLTLKESFKYIDNLKIESDKLSKMSEEEKREYWEELKKTWKEKNNK